MATYGRRQILGAIGGISLAGLGGIYISNNESIDGYFEPIRLKADISVAAGTEKVLNGLPDRHGNVGYVGAHLINSKQEATKKIDFESIYHLESKDRQSLRRNYEDGFWVILTAILPDDAYYDLQHHTLAINGDTLRYHPLTVQKSKKSEDAPENGPLYHYRYHYWKQTRPALGLPSRATTSWKNDSWKEAVVPEEPKPGIQF